MRASCTQFLVSGTSVLVLFREFCVAGGATSMPSACVVFAVEWLIGALSVIFVVMCLKVRKVAHSG
jgi:hypothetical protein